MKINKILCLVLLSALLVLSSVNLAVVNAQNNATVVILESVGGTTSPTGVNMYPGGTQVAITATPTDEGFEFAFWVISIDQTDSTSFNNPLTLTVTAGVTYALQAVFQPIQIPPGAPPVFPDIDTAAIVVVLTSAGGTTSPPPGTYALADATSLMLTATPQSGWQFSHWAISGTPTDHGDAPLNLTPSDNPYTVDHGYGNRYVYQAIFTPIGSATPTPSPADGDTIGGMSTETWIIIALVIVIVVILIGFGVFASRRK